MTGNMEKSALILSVGFIVGIVILTSSIKKNTSRLSEGLVNAGGASRSSFSASFPSDLRIQTSEGSKELTQERKKQLIDSFVLNCVGRIYENKEIQNVIVKEAQAKYWGNNLDFNGDIVFEDGSIYEGFEAHLYADGFGGYEGFVRTKDGSKLIIESISIE